MYLYDSYRADLLSYYKSKTDILDKIITYISYI